MAVKEKRGLGIGLEALFGTEFQMLDDKEVITLPITKVEPRQDQPREHFDEERLQDLAASISRHGLIQPVIVRRLDSGDYQIIAGERRWRAARLAGLTEIPVRVLHADDQSVAELALVENLQREDLNPMEEARGYQKLMQDYALTQEEAAESERTGIRYGGERSSLRRARAHPAGPGRPGSAEARRRAGAGQDPFRAQDRTDGLPSEKRSGQSADRGAGRGG